MNDSREAVPELAPPPVAESDTLRHEILAIIANLENPSRPCALHAPEEGGRDMLAEIAQILVSLPVTVGSRRLVETLVQDRRFVEVLIDGRWCRAIDATAVARHSSPAFEEELERQVAALIDNGRQDEDEMLRLLALFEAAGAERRCVWYQGELLSSHNLLIRSKAAKLVARGCRRAALAGRLLHDADPRVQASAVESLWALGNADGVVRLLVEASRSSHHRVAGNAAVGLHHIDETQSIRLLRRMLAHADPRFRTSGVWAMGESGDSRFLTDLNTLLQEPSGVPRVVTLRAMSRIRAAHRLSSEAGKLELRVTTAVVNRNLERRVKFTLVSQGAVKLRALDLVVREGDHQVEDYELIALPSPALIAAGFVLPPLNTAFGRAVHATYEKSRRFQRSSDVWRTANYREEDRVALAAVYRLSSTVIHMTGSKHLFFVLDGPQNEPIARMVDRLRDRLVKERITLHVLIVRSLECPLLREALQKIPGCTIIEADPVNLLSRFEDACAAMTCVYELRYRLPEATAEGEITVASPQGAGAVRIPSWLEV